MKPPLDTRLLDPARVMAPAPESLRAIHAEVVDDIAFDRFGFPTPEFPHFRTFTNAREQTQKIFTNLGRELFPDIVVVEWPERVPRMVGEVAMPGMPWREMAENVWLPESRLKDVAFYLYAPAGYADEARKLLKELGFRKQDVGFRTWRRIVGTRTVDTPPLRF